MNLNKKIVVSKKKIKKYIDEVFDLNYKISNYLRDDKYTGYEKDLNIGTGSESSGIVKGQGTNPSLWAIGHYCYFYEYHFFRHVIKGYKFFVDNGDLYDSFITSREYRFSFRPHNKEKIFEYIDYVKNKLIYLLENNLLDENLTYFFLLTILHNHMHCESMIFTKKLLSINSSSNINNFNYYLNNEEFQIEKVFIKGGNFKQGTFEGENLIAFDNEKPQFEVKINDFYASKYCVTEEIVINFINDNGYKNKNLWSLNGWRWVIENKIDCPFYWIKYNDEYFIKDFDKVRKIVKNLPACHLTWYEAEAIAKWMDGRLPTESEWEYMATNHGTTKYPWGNELKNNVANLNYSGNICDVSLFSKGDNKEGVRQLFGNVWEWCQEPIYPYDGYKIDPIYREFSYPFFGFKKILRGGCWAVPDILINSRYRNAQMPDTRIQFTGVRVVFDKK